LAFKKICQILLNFYPFQYFDSIVFSAAVNAARDSNAAELKRLQDDLKTINEKIDFCEKRVDDLDSENSKLQYVYS
jgi:peptidoglycan hydrolase CwlO-like protein